MTRALRYAACLLMIGLAGLASTAQAQRRGGILTIHSPDSPGGMSVLEEATQYAVGPMMGVMSNLLMFDQHARQNSLETIVPDLATEWGWSADGLAFTLKLRQGVRWHDGKPFTAKDVLCTWELLMETGTDRLRINPRKGWYDNLERLSANGDFEVTFHLKQKQPAFPMLIAAGVSPVYPCHVPAREMRTNPIGTGPYKFVEYKPNQHIKVTRNADYWKPGLPYLDGIEYVIIADPATANLAFIAGKLDMTFPQNVSMPLLKNIKAERPSAICEITPGGGINRHLIVNRERAPFDNADLRRAMALSLDRQAFIDIIAEGQGEIGGVLQPAPDGLWGMPTEQLRALPGYDPDVKKNREQARQIMRGLGYSAENKLKVKLLTRNIPLYRAPAIILLDQLREVFIEAELDAVETATYFPRVARKEFTIGLNLQTAGPDPDTILLSFYACKGNQNWDKYCNADVDAMIRAQSMETDQAKRKQMVWEIERKLAEENVRPIIFYNRSGSCWQPHVKNVSVMVNSGFSGHRREDIWLDK